MDLLVSQLELHLVRWCRTAVIKVSGYLWRQPILLACLMVNGPFFQHAQVSGLMNGLYSNKQIIHGIVKDVHIFCLSRINKLVKMGLLLLYRISCLLCLGWISA